MARSTFGGSASDAIWATLVSGGFNYLVSVTGQAITCWSAASGGTQYTDLLLNSSPVSSIPVGIGGVIPSFQGPNGVTTTMYADAGAGYRVRLDAQTAFATLPAFVPIVDALYSGYQSCAITVIGDSTGYTTGTTRWPYLLAPSLAALFPGYAVQMRTWNMSTESYDAAVTTAGTPSSRSHTLGVVTQHPGFGAAVTGDLDVRVKVAFSSWPLGNTNLLTRWGITAGKCAFVFGTRSTGNISLQWSADGLNSAGFITSTALGAVVTAGTPIWLRATLQASTGNVAFYTSPDGVTWTARGTGGGAGATSVYNPGWNMKYQLGGYADNTGFVPGQAIYEVEFLDTAGTSVVPRYPDMYTNANGGTLGTFAGQPVLTIMNGSAPGQSTPYFNDSTRLPKMTRPDYNTLAVVTNWGHNEGKERGPNISTGWDSFLSQLRTRIPQVPVAVTLQNPQLPPAFYPDSHRARLADLASWAKMNDADTIDVYRAFTTSPLGVAGLLDSDGTHPSDAAGSPLWRNVVLTAMGLPN